jgi:hypothetical protein
MAEIDKIENQITKVDKLTASLGALTSKFTALVEDGKGFNEIQKSIGKRLEKARTDFTKLVNESDKFVEATRKNKNITEEQAESLTDLEKKIKSLGSTYSTLANKNLQELKKAQSEYKKQLTELAEQAKNVAKEERDIIRKREADAKRALKDVRERIRVERAAQKAKYDEETAQIKELLRQQKNRLTQIDEEEKKKKAQRAADRKRRKELLSDLARENAAVDKSGKAAAAAAEKQKFFGQAFRDAFSPQSIGKAIASIIKFISIYEILGTIVTKVREFFVDSVRSFIDFDEKVSRLSAVTGASGQSLTNLSDEIRTVAIETRFTANEVAELAISLGKLGVSAKDIPTLLRPISIAAQATGEDLTAVGESIIKVTNQFQLNVEQAAAVSAVLTAAVNESSLSLESFNTAIGYVGPIANQAGLSFDQTAKALGVLSDSGFSASRAGTGLRRVLLEIKKPGEDIIETLQGLADRNIGLSEAQGLVGKQGAAQLLVLTQNIDVLKQVTLAEEGFANQLQATAVQMSSVSGQVELLSSSYNELLLSIGEFLVNGEYVLELIGLLSEDSESLGRGYKLLRNESERLGDTFSARVAKGLQNGSKSFEILNEVLKNTDDEGIRKVAESVAKVDPKNINDLRKALDELQQSYTNQRGLNPFAFFGETDIEDVQAYRGAVEQLEKQVVASSNNKFFEAGQRAVNKVYKDQVTEIENITNAVQRRDKALKVSQQYLTGARKLEEQALKLTEENSEANQKQINFIQGRASAYRTLAARLSEYTNLEEDKAKKDPTDKYLSLFNQEKKQLELRIKDIQLRQDLESNAYKQRVKEINEEFDLREKGAKTIEERANLEIERSQKLTQESEKYKDSLYEISEGIGVWDKDSTEFFNKYSKLFKGSEKNTLNLENVNEQFRQSLVKLGEATAKLGTDATITGQQYADEFLASGLDLIEEFNDGLKALGEGFNDTAFGQYKLSLAQREYIKGLDEQIKKLEEYYESVKATLSPEERKKIESALIALRDSRNKAIVGGVINDKDQEEFKRQFLELGKIGGKEFIIGIDITLAQAIQGVLDTTLNALSRFNDVALENTKNRLEAEKEAIENQSEIEDEILSAKLENQLITEAEYRAQVEKNRKKELAQRNAIDKQIFEAEKKRDRQNALTDYLSSLASIIPNLITTEKIGDPIRLSLASSISAALATVAYGAEVRAINQRKFFPTKFADGGLVSGPSHEQGGVPFSVQGRGGYEMEGGEYIVNKRATQKYKSVLDQINSYGKSNYKFAQGGIVKDPAIVANRQIELLEDIASSNVSLVGKLDKPVRAFVASDDLRSDSNALRIKERNSQL